MFKEIERHMEKISSGIGVAIITYNRPEYYRKVLESIPRNMIDFLVVVNDGYNIYTRDNDAEIVIQNNKQMGVAVSKNYAIKILVEKFNCEHVFLIEDDIIIKRPDVFEAYIKAANSTGIHHLCYEKVAGNEKSLKYTLEQPDGVKLGFYHKPQGAFMYINANLIKKLGYFDEKYKNAFEHIDFAFNLIKNNVAPPFWYFPDLLDSQNYLEDIEGSSQNSSITNKDNYKENWELSAKHFVSKWGHFTNTIPDNGTKDLISKLTFLQTNYSRKKIINKNQKLCVIIPYRDREKALKILIPNLKEYLSNQITNFNICIIEQNNNDLFNKGLMNNIGFLLNPDYDYYCFHDVDLIPEFSDYSYPELPSHLSTYCSQFNYIETPDSVMGGVITFKKEHFYKVNGYPISYVGWGSEDTNLKLRCEIMQIYPFKYQLGKYFSVPHIHRLNNPVEYEHHLINGKKMGDFEKNNNNMFEDGLNQIKLDDFKIEKTKTLECVHFKIK
jgi:GT2 family glycosyltransferase